MSPLEAALQEDLHAYGHPNPLSAAARLVDLLRGHPDLHRHAQARAWLWAHTAQPNGDPWTADPDHLDRAATDLATTLAGGTP